ncbi:MAG: phasin family protein [Deltaproteobacteria bacterium]|nr:phasin family protein [Deltaproteobacteria bacterium]
MFELIKKSLLAGLGAAVVTKEKVEETTKKLVDEGKISMEEAEKLSKELLESGQAQWQELQSKITAAVKKAVSSLDLAARKDLEALEEKVEDLRKRLETIEESDRPVRD